MFMHNRPKQVVLVNKVRGTVEKEQPEKVNYITTLKNIISLFPIFTILIIVIGLIRLNLYYSGFGINIFHFLKISEVIVIVVMDLLTIVLSILGTTLIAIIPAISNTNIKESDTNREAYEKRSKKTKRFFKFSFFKSNRLSTWIKKNKSKINKALIYLVRIAMWALLILCLYTIFYPESHEDLLQGISLLILSSPFTLTALSPSLMDLIFTSAARVFGLIFFVMASYYFLLQIETDYKQTKNGKYIGTTIICKDSSQKHISTKDYFYVGKTENFIFFYNNNDSSSNIIPVTEVKLFHLSKH